MKVGKNCWDALWHLRKRYRSIDIWIDAICIDQKNQKEKTIQLPLMGDIYRKADCVLVWLGEGDHETNRAMEFLGKGGLPFDVAFDLAKGDRILTRYLLPWYYGLCMFGRCITFRRKRHWDGLQNIFSRVWVTRLWTLQEVVLPHHIVLICGDVAICWQSFEKALRLMRFMDGRPGGPRFPPSWKQWWRFSTFRSSIQELLDKVSDEILEHDNRKVVEKSEFELEVRFLETTWTSFRVWYFCAAASLIPAFYGVTLLDARFKEDILRLPLFTRLIIIVVKFLAIIAVITTIIWPQMMSKNSMTEMTLDMHEHIFTEIVKRDATNEKDRYFGVSALIQQVVRHNDTPLPLVSSSDFTTGTPDYNTSLTLVYEGLFFELLKWTNSLDILLLRSYRRCSCENCSCQKTVAGPSWLVNWAFTDDRWLLMRHYLVLEYSFLTFRKVYKTFSGATSFERRHAKADLLVDGRLHVRGMLIGMITWCSELLPQDKNLKKRETILLALGMFQEAFRHSSLQQVKDSMEQLCTTVDRYSEEHSQWDVDYLSKIIHTCHLELAYTRLRRWWLWHKLRSLIPAGSSWDLHINLMNYLAKDNRKVFRCQNGGDYSGVGFSCEHVQEGDLVVLIAGVSLPMVIRLQESTVNYGYQVINPAFLGGAMNGELCRDVDQDNLSDLLFV